ncbi:MAG: RNA polymerase sigma-70 factor [Bacteroidales bacterium]|jgi:RNA polymerase sigma-70 factor (ECF subfamily)
MTAATGNSVDSKYEEMFRMYFSSLCYFALKYISDLDTCKEIVHNVFVNIWEKREEYDFDKPAKSYLFTSVYNRCMNHIRDSRKYKSDADISEAHDYSDFSQHTEQIEAAELESKIWQVINSLPEKCREVFVLNRFEGKKYGEVADYLNISVKTVETQMSKALKTLRDNLKDYIHLLLFLILKNLW